MVKLRLEVGPRAALFEDFVPNVDQLGRNELGNSGDFVAEVDLKALKPESELGGEVEGGGVGREGGATRRWRAITGCSRSTGRKGWS